MNIVSDGNDVNNIKISNLSVQDEINIKNKMDNLNISERVNEINKSNNVQNVDSLDAAAKTVLRGNNSASQHCTDWLVKSDFTATDSQDAESEVYDTDYASSIADSDVAYLTSSTGSLQQKYKIENLIQRDANNMAIDAAGNIFKHIKVDNSENVHVGQVTNITIYKGSSSNKKPKEKRNALSNVEMQEQAEGSLFLGPQVSAATISPLDIIVRKRWLAMLPLEVEEFPRIPKYVVISHTATEPGSTIAENIPLVRDIQSFHIESRKWSDIAYNFLIGEDGKVYEGRGWKRVGAHTLGYNKVAIGISFIGCYMTTTPPARSIRTLSLLLELGVRDGHIPKDYGLLGHCQCSPVESPGKPLFALLQEHPHWISEPKPPEA